MSDDLPLVALGPCWGAWAVGSATRPDVAHLVVRLVGGSWACSCEAGVRGRECRHVKAVKAEMDAAVLRRADA